MYIKSYTQLQELKELKKERSRLPHWLEDSHLAKKEDGEFWIDFCVGGWVKELSKTEENK